MTLFYLILSVICLQKGALSSTNFFEIGPFYLSSGANYSIPLPSDHPQPSAIDITPENNQSAPYPFFAFKERKKHLFIAIPQSAQGLYRSSFYFNFSHILHSPLYVNQKSPSLILEKESLLENMASVALLSWIIGLSVLCTMGSYHICFARRRQKHYEYIDQHYYHPLAIAEKERKAKSFKET